MISFETACSLTHKLTNAEAANVMNQMLGRISMEPGCDALKQHCADFIEYYLHRRGKMRIIGVPQITEAQVDEALRRDDLTFPELAKLQKLKARFIKEAKRKHGKTKP